MVYLNWTKVAIIYEEDYGKLNETKTKKNNCIKKMKLNVATAKIEIHSEERRSVNELGE